MPHGPAHARLLSSVAFLWSDFCSLCLYRLVLPPAWPPPSASILAIAVGGRMSHLIHPRNPRPATQLARMRKMMNRLMKFRKSAINLRAPWIGNAGLGRRSPSLPLPRRSPSTKVQFWRVTGRVAAGVSALLPPAIVGGAQALPHPPGTPRRSVAQLLLGFQSHLQLRLLQACATTMSRCVHMIPGVRRPRHLTPRCHRHRPDRLDPQKASPRSSICASQWTSLPPSMSWKQIVTAYGAVWRMSATLSPCTA